MLGLEKKMLLVPEKTIEVGSGGGRNGILMKKQVEKNIPKSSYYESYREKRGGEACGIPNLVWEGNANQGKSSESH